MLLNWHMKSLDNSSLTNTTSPVLNKEKVIMFKVISRANRKKD